MQSAFLWLIMAIALAPVRQRPAAPQRGSFGWLRRLLARPVQHAARHSAWTRAMEELALVPARPRPAAARAAPRGRAR
jgi:hypothetical protein